MCNDVRSLRNLTTPIRESTAPRDPSSSHAPLMKPLVLAHLIALCFPDASHIAVRSGKYCSPAPPPCL
eukprot:3859214-Prymnesium_polylepis.1